MLFKIEVFFYYQLWLEIREMWFIWHIISVFYYISHKVNSDSWFHPTEIILFCILYIVHYVLYEIVRHLKLHRHMNNNPWWAIILQNINSL